MSRVVLPKKSFLKNAAVNAASGGGPRVTVIIPTYNRASMVPRAIRSVLDQTISDLELIVVEDASPDNTAEVVSRIEDPRLRLVRLAKNGGDWHARNVAIAQARGEWVAFLDDDNEWLPDKLERQFARIEQGPERDAAVINCRFQLVTEDGPQPVRGTGQRPEGDVLDLALGAKQVIIPSAHMVKRSALLAVGGFEESLVGLGDYDLWVRLALAGYRFASAPEVLVIKYEAHEHISADPVVRVRAFRGRDRRWGALTRERFGVDEYRRWRRNSSKKHARAHRKHVRRIMRSGSRAQAWRYARRMVPGLPWGASFVAKALAVALFGRVPYRLSRLAKRRTKAPALVSANEDIDVGAGRP